MKIVITGGHLSPLLAVVDAFPKSTDILVIGRKRALEGDAAFSLEYQEIQKRGIPFKSIVTARLQRKFTKYTIPSLLKFPYGFFRAVSILKRFKPDIVLSFGSYISLPVNLAAFVLGIPLVLHEQTFGAGTSNKISSIFAKKICVSWEESKKYFPESKTVLTGIPMRKEVINTPGKIPVFNQKFENIDLPMIYVTGGSLGSHAINLLIEKCIDDLLKKFKILHQTGDAREFGDFDRLEQKKEKLDDKIKSRYVLAKFVDPLITGSVIKNSAFVVSRSGINTVSELIFLGKPAILIPLPYSQNDEQVKNAEFFKDLGIGEIFFQDRSPDNFLKLIYLMLENLEKYNKKAKETEKILQKDAASKIVDVLTDIIHFK
ncbi:MAG: UDP-N-acetylglucosamine--N-acetylmuramyl-(pentapeptide) pyrophosphoryl-undecaprenol N-acetylglucosamine transferase [Patescibacteria group bacterium]|nr:UDP-N-acetylglucosamine--N-acetylmuramyl-(pentapeptide) pyrophosphoryl-undecaprenol N-acetylglucosamine transferase [Patescibacteria group bacterium]